MTTNRVRHIFRVIITYIILLLSRTLLYAEALHRIGKYFLPTCRAAVSMRLSVSYLFRLGIIRVTYRKQCISMQYNVHCSRMQLTHTHTQCNKRNNNNRYSSRSTRSILRFGLTRDEVCMLQHTSGSRARFNNSEICRAKTTTRILL